MSLDNGLYESVINKLIYEEIIKKYDRYDKYIDKKEIDKEEANEVTTRYVVMFILTALNTKKLALIILIANSFLM